MPLQPNALTSIEKYKTYMELDSTDTTRDAAIAIAINGVSEWLEGECGRSFQLATYTETLTGTGRQKLLLTHYPVQAIQTITPPQKYTLVPDEGALFRSAGWYGEITVEYTAGYPVIPPDLETACIELVAMRLEMKSSNHLKTEVIGPLRNEYVSELPYAIQSVIDRYRRVVVA